MIPQLLSSDFASPTRRYGVDSRVVFTVLGEKRSALPARHHHQRCRCAYNTPPSHKQRHNSSYLAFHPCVINVFTALLTQEGNGRVYATVRKLGVVRSLIGAVFGLYPFRPSCLVIGTSHSSDPVFGVSLFPSPATRVRINRSDAYTQDIAVYVLRLIASY